MNLILAVLATLRLTRLMTTDYWGEWLVVRPAKRWAGRYESAEISRRIAAEEHHRDNDPHDPWTWQARLVSMFDCPFCWGFWAGVGVLLSLAIARAVPPLLPAWRFVMGAFALNYITGHVSARLDG